MRKSMLQSRRLSALAAWALLTACLPTAVVAADETAKSVLVEHGGDGPFVRPFKSRHGPLTEQEMAIARNAWTYFAAYTQPETGLANSVGSYPSTTLWDTASHVSGAVSAYELGIIDKAEFDRRMYKLLATFKTIKLFRGEMPNKIYHTRVYGQSWM
jgi:hypothetical protein